MLNPRERFLVPIDVYDILNDNKCVVENVFILPDITLIVSSWRFYLTVVWLYVVGTERV